jgi:orotate phosphoribosyltransferase
MVTYQHLANNIINLVMSAGRDFDYIFGIPKNGLIPAVMYSNLTHIPLLIDADKIPDSGRVLIIDDSYNTGKSMEPYLKYENAKFGAVYTRSTSPEWLHTGKIMDGPRLFEWEIFTRKRVSYDIDGLLCPDVPRGVDYAEYLENAPLLYKPAYPVKCIITARYKRYRAITEAWLARHGIKYEHLIMSHRKDRQDRKANTAADKAKACKKHGVKTFLESSDKAAIAMSKYGIKVISIESKRTFGG